MHGRTSPKLLAAAMVGWGALLLTATHPLMRRLTDGPATSQDVAAARALGAREVVQGAVLAAVPRTAAVGAAVDVLHAATMLLLSATSRRHRRAALLSAVVAVLLAAGSGRAARELR